MNILMINKFLHPNGGSETYIFKLGGELTRLGHRVEYFGMEHEGRCVGNRVEAYTSDMDFHGGSKLGKLLYPVKTVYSREARKQLRKVLEDLQPDVCHLNNFNYQLTPSIILEIRKWSRQTGHPCKILYTAHDLQLVCPNHLCVRPDGSLCQKCIGGHYGNCLKGKCIHGSTMKSAVGMAEAVFWKWKKVYRQIDRVICCSEFMKGMLDTNPIFRDKTLALHNFIDATPWKTPVKQDYVLYFGRFSKEKGVEALLEVCKALPEVPFVFAGTGPLESELNALPNVKNVGFQTGEALSELIRSARFTLCPSECYENCPFTVMESQQLGTGVLGADIGGIPELIDAGKTGMLFPAGDRQALKEAIVTLWEDKTLTETYTEHCRHVRFDTVESYTRKLLKLYQGE